MLLCRCFIVLWFICRTHIWAWNWKNKILGNTRHSKNVNFYQIIVKVKGSWENIYKYPYKTSEQLVQPPVSYCMTKNWQLTHGPTYIHNFRSTIFFQFRSYIFGFLGFWDWFKAVDGVTFFGQEHLRFAESDSQPLQLRVSVHPDMKSSGDGSSSKFEIFLLDIQ